LHYIETNIWRLHGEVFGLEIMNR